ncbi:MAG: acyl carrier protein [Gammaproteobacteria bacterium (ex Lamellibrachia satsuma)]|nr:MAG: acyl carrier protein [Gammaproteobacteria bacterium (ex Lamellibrachia satsuma)]RRS32689.1 MAG: acyl carrier protein [Gammaproteobacteria bacterium (ex Lamellibrachia satsuma)]RRS37373.1 MAG: acyl carrier protein [Gammaproteobacteria bacterium (ex Lamellibrachia satsuma)]
MAIREELRNYVLDNYLFTDDQSKLKDGDSFLETGILDSNGVMEVIFFLEDEYGVNVSQEEMIPENLDSVSRIVKFVESKNG